MVRVIADPGSCHLGDLDLAKKLIDAAKDAGAWAIKFQLFPKRFEKNGNIRLPYCWFKDVLVPYAVDKNITIFASVFDSKAFDCVCECGDVIDYVKLAYGQKMFPVMRTMWRGWWRHIIIASGNENYSLPYAGVRLYCIPEYPVRGKVDFRKKFSAWDGFSDHTLGVSQTKRAIDYGARYIEKHLRLGTKRDDTVPDGRFAVTPKQLKEICDYAR